MSQDKTAPKVWDLERYHVRAQAARGAADEPDPLEAMKEAKRLSEPGELNHVAQKDDGDWIAPAEGKTRPRFVESGSIFWIAFAGAILSVLTLGLYRFWMVTNLRRAYAGSIRVESDQIEYTGTGWEKLIGFLIAIALLAIYLSLANVLLLFAGMTTLDGFSLFTPFSLIAVAPFVFFAQYRSQRYMLSRLRWRGIRFGLEGGAWGYTLRSLLWSVLAVATLGLLYPYLHFRQAKYIAERSRFGSLRFRQDGSWLGLLAYWIWLYIGLGMVFLAAWGLAEEMRLGEEGVTLILGIFAPLALMLGFLLFMNYQQGAFRYLWDNRSLGETRIENDLSVGRVIWLYVRGSFAVTVLTALTTAVAGGVLIGGGFALAAALAGGGDQAALAEHLRAFLEEERLPPPDAVGIALPLIVGVALSYFFFFAASYAFGQSFVTQPILRHRVEAMLLRNPRALRAANQRAADDPAEAGGFADALGVDMGAGFG